MKYAFWTVFALGFLACSTLGIGPTLARSGGNWLSPAMVGGIVLGGALLVLAIAFAFPAIRPVFLRTDAVMVYTLVGLIVAKVGISAVHAALVR